MISFNEIQFSFSVFVSVLLFYSQCRSKYLLLTRLFQQYKFIRIYAWESVSCLHSEGENIILRSKDYTILFSDTFKDLISQHYWFPACVLPYLFNEWTALYSCLTLTVCTGIFKLIVKLCFQFALNSGSGIFLYSGVARNLLRGEGKPRGLGKEALSRVQGQNMKTLENTNRAVTKVDLLWRGDMHPCHLWLRPCSSAL